MSNVSEIKQMIESAEAALKKAKKLLFEYADSEGLSTSDVNSTPLSSADDDATQVIEGIFNGNHMIAPDGESYPIPSNYASKSKLIAGDLLKLSIMPDGRFLYKQIGPVARKTLIGTLIHEDGQYKVIAEGKKYHVLLASVTYYKGNVGDKVTIIIPVNEETDWAAIEAILPADVSQMSIHEEEPEEEEIVDF